jgi:hypothetical protein
MVDVRNADDENLIDAADCEGHDEVSDYLQHL